MSLFLGWMPDTVAQATLATLQEQIASRLQAGVPRHDWRKPAQWHMTLRYLGESISDAQRQRIDAAMSARAACTAASSATLVGAQYWPHARVLVTKLDASDPLKAMLKQLEVDMQACGFAKERAQTAHVTLAYLPRGAKPPAMPELPAQGSQLVVDHVQLLQTVPGGYMSLASWPLAKPA